MMSRRAPHDFLRIFRVYRYGLRLRRRAWAQLQMITRRAFSVLCVLSYVLIALLFCDVADAQSTYPTDANQLPYATALSDCQASISNLGSVSVACTVGVDPNPTGDGEEGFEYAGVTYGGSNVGGWYDFVGAPPPSCTQGKVIGAGTTVGVTSSGENVYQGCCLSLALGGPNSGLEVETGSACPSTTGSQQTLPATTTRKNADGSTTSCVGSQCLTYYPNDNGPAPSSSSSGSTTYSSTTSTPASTSSSSFTSTTSGTSSGDGSGSGSGSFTGTTTGTATTDNPASASTSSGKCTTGVCDVGDADVDPGSFYQTGGDTIQQTFNTYIQTIQSSPLISTVSGIFTIQASGTCPTASLSATKYWSAQTFDIVCEEPFTTFFSGIGALVLLGAAYAAIRIAIY